jgi:hypothetical protein
VAGIHPIDSLVEASWTQPLIIFPDMCRFPLSLKLS